jgi:hypothetical protein
MNMTLQGISEIPAEKESFFHVLLDNQNVGTRNANILFLDREIMEEEDYFLISQHYSKKGFLVVSRGIIPNRKN